MTAVEFDDVGLVIPRACVFRWAAKQETRDDRDCVALRLVFLGAGQCVVASGGDVAGCDVAIDRGLAAAVFVNRFAAADDCELVERLHRRNQRDRE